MQKENTRKARGKKRGLHEGIMQLQFSSDIAP